MRAAMLKLSGLVARRRWVVIGIWLAVVAAAVPLASRQTENLTGGGFDVPASESQQVSAALSSA